MKLFLARLHPPEDSRQGEAAPAASGSSSGKSDPLKPLLGGPCAGRAAGMETGREHWPLTRWLLEWVHGNSSSPHCHLSVAELSSAHEEEGHTEPCPHLSHPGPKQRAMKVGSLCPPGKMWEQGKTLTLPIWPPLQITLCSRRNIWNQKSKA